jgi:hypothetical protein
VNTDHATMPISVFCIDTDYSHLPGDRAEAIPRAVHADVGRIEPLGHASRAPSLFMPPALARFARLSGVASQRDTPLRACGQRSRGRRRSVGAAVIPNYHPIDGRQGRGEDPAMNIHA